MNRQYLLQNDDGKNYCCILSAEEDPQEQWERIFDVKKGYGFSVDVGKNRIDIVDYYHAETRASFRILSATDTEEAPTGRLISL